MKPKLRGSLDRCEPQCIGGWARLPPGKARLTLFCGDRQIGTCIADLRRPDLAAAGMGDGCFGFRFEPRPALTPQDLRALVIQVAGADEVFRYGTVVPIPRGPHEAAPLYRLAAAPPRKRFETCILHIGTEKTGSTTLQTFLCRNRGAIHRAGLFLPLSLSPHARLGVMNHVHLPAVAMEDSVLGGDLRGAAGIGSAAALEGFRRTTFDRFGREAARAPARCRSVLLSSEHCHSRLATPASIRHLKSFLDPFCDAYQIHVYLRPQHELAMSRHGMAVMLGQIDEVLFPQVLPPGPRADQAAADRAYFDYDALLDRWAEVFGPAAIRPRVFQRQALAGGTVVDDFAAVLGLDAGALRAVPDLGGNISAAAQRFLLGLYDTQAGRMLPIELRLWLSERMRQIAPGSGILPARAAAQAFAAQFAAGNAAVRARWFPGRACLFDEDFSRYPDHPGNPDIPAEAFRAFVALIAEARARPARLPAPARSPISAG